MLNAAGCVFGDDALRISESVLRQGERHTMLGQVVGILASVPLEARHRHGRSLPLIWLICHIEVWRDLYGEISAVIASLMSGRSDGAHWRLDLAVTRLRLPGFAAEGHDGGVFLGSDQYDARSEARCVPLNVRV